jgi:hypothetical protein
VLGSDSPAPIKKRIDFRSILLFFICLNSDLSSKLDASKLTFTNVQAVNFTEDTSTGDISITFVITSTDWVLLKFYMAPSSITLSVSHDAGNTWTNIWIK